MTRLRGSAVVLAVLSLFTALACAEESQTDKVNLESEEQQTLYAIGVVVAARLPHFDMSEDELALVKAGLADGLQGKAPRVDMKVVAPKIEPYLLQRVAEATKQEKAAGDAFRAGAAREPGATTTASGMVYREMRPGAGDGPSSADSVKIRYRGTLRDGSEFDSSNEPVTFTLSGTVPCFAEGLQKMKPGGKSQFVCPPTLAYGDNGFPPRIRPGATLVFEVELLEVIPAAAAEAGE